MALQSGALADNDSGTTLRTAAAGYMRPAVTMPNTMSARRRLLQTSSGGLYLVGTLPTSTVTTYCKYLNEDAAAALEAVLMDSADARQPCCFTICLPDCPVGQTCSSATPGILAVTH